MFRTSILLGLIVLLGAESASADKVLLKDGRRLSGTAKKHKDRVDLTTDDGTKLSFPKDEVKRIIFESTTSPRELVEMYDTFEDLIAPAMGLLEPEQREFSKQTRTAQRRRDPYSGSRTVEWEWGRAREPVSSDKFVDDWVRYAAHFKAVAKTRAFKRHMRPRRGKKSLAEFAHYPPEELEELGLSLRDAIEAVKDTFEYAETADRAVGSIRGGELEHDRKIARAKNRARLMDANKQATSEEKALARARIQRLIDKKEVSHNARKLSADNAVNQVASSRIVAIRQLSEFRRLLEEVFEPAGSAPSATP